MHDTTCIFFQEYMFVDAGCIAMFPDGQWSWHNDLKRRHKL